MPDDHRFNAQPWSSMLWRHHHWSASILSLKTFLFWLCPAPASNQQQNNTAALAWSSSNLESNCNCCSILFLSWSLGFFCWQWTIDATNRSINWARLTFDHRQTQQNRDSDENAFQSKVQSDLNSCCVSKINLCWISISFISVDSRQRLLQQRKTDWWCISVAQ